MFEPVGKEGVINKIMSSKKNTKNCNIMAQTGLLDIDTHPYELWSWGQWRVAGAAAPPAG